MLCNKAIHNTVWTVDNLNPNLREGSVGQPINANSPVLIRHVAT